MKKLSYRAKLLLLLIDQRTKRDIDGSLSRFFVPMANGQYLHKRNGDSLKQSLWLHGAADANCLKGLERHGLIKRPDTSLPQKYIYAITEDGRLAVESFWDEME